MDNQQDININTEINTLDKRKNVIVLGAILVIFIILVGGFFAFKANNKPQKLSQTPTQTTTPKITETILTTTTPTQSSTPTPLLPTGVISQNNGLLIYNGHGISFTVLADNLALKEVGNRIYLYNPNQDYSYGSYVSIFDKDPNATIDQAITKSVLTGFLASDCPITDSKAIATQPTNQLTAWIKYSINNLDETGNNPVNPLKCPTDYTRTSGLMYFMVDKNHPDKLIFFNVGGGTYPASKSANSLSWSEALIVTQ